MWLLELDKMTENWELEEYDNFSKGLCLSEIAPHIDVKR
jgi:hypothetical protein